MRRFAISLIGRDRPGIVAAVSEVLLAHEGNIEDSQMTILRGRFTIVLIVSAPDGADATRLEEQLEQVRHRLELDALALSEIAGAEPIPEPGASHIVSVYGVDHPGIVHAISSALAGREVNITDLTTRLVGDTEGEPLYAMMIEVAVPPERPIAEIEQLLRAVGEDQGVEVTVRPLEQDVL